MNLAMNVDKQYKHGLRERSRFFCEQRGQLYYIGGQKDNGEDMARRSLRLFSVIPVSNGSAVNALLIVNTELYIIFC